jgi:hypothetical protein
MWWAGVMARKSDIHSAFVAAVQLSQKGYRFLQTDDFVRQLRLVNHHFTPDDANAWIERNQPDFCDKTADNGSNRYWILRNMGRVH